MNSNRRVFLVGMTSVGTGLLIPACSITPITGGPAKDNGNEAVEVSPVEDLMREHGVLNRTLLIYDEILARLNSQKGFPPEVLAATAGVVRRFIEDYHEKLEEDTLFPRFEKAGKFADLVRTLRQQHEAGRRLTDRIQHLSILGALRSAQDRLKLTEAIRLFIRMYRPHEAREDTVLFPALREIVSAHEYDALGEEFEKKEHDLFGGDGFEAMVAKVAGLEKELGLYALSQFTPAESEFAGFGSTRSKFFIV